MSATQHRIEAHPPLVPLPLEVTVGPLHLLDARGGVSLTHRGFIKIHILHHADEAPVYGLALIAELRRHRYELSPGTLYPVLHQLEEAGRLNRLDRVVNGRVRKYYALTRRGTAVLSQIREKTAELVGEVLEAHIARRAARARRTTRRATRTRPNAQGELGMIEIAAGSFQVAACHE